MGIILGPGTITLRSLEPGDIIFSSDGTFPEMEFVEADCSTGSLPVKLSQEATFTCKARINTRVLFRSRVFGKRWRNKFKALRMIARRNKT